MLEFILYIFETEMSKLTGAEFMLMLVISVAFIAFIFGLGFFIVKFMYFLFRGFRNIISAKSKCQNIQCRVCGRTLDRCVCAKNKGRSNASRLHQHNLEEKAKKHHNKKSGK